MTNLGAYNLVDTTDVDKIIAQLETEGMSETDIFKFKLDMIVFVNYLETYLNKNLAQADEFDLEKFYEYALNDPSLTELAERRVKNARKGLEIYKKL